MIELFNLSLVLALAGGVTLQGSLQGFSLKSQVFIVLGFQIVEHKLLPLDVFLVSFSIDLVVFDYLSQTLFFLRLKLTTLFVKTLILCLEFLHLGQRVLVHHGRIDVEVQLMGDQAMRRNKMEIREGSGL